MHPGFTNRFLVEYWLGPPNARSNRPSSTFTTAVMNANPVFTRHTDLGQILVNTATHAFSFTPGCANQPAPPGGAPPATTRADDGFADPTKNGPEQLPRSAFPSPGDDGKAPPAAEESTVSFPMPGWASAGSSLDAVKLGFMPDPGINTLQSQ
jgi:hypothetical protein